jgi:lipoprotein-releasing system permease protein
VAGAVLDGVDFATVGQVTELTERVVQGRLPTASVYELAETVPEVAMGTALAERLGATEGSEIRLIIPFTGEDQDGAPEPGSGAPKTVKVKVVGLVKMGMYEYDSKFIFATLPIVQRFVGQPGKVTTFNMRLVKGSDSRTASDLLADAFGYPFRAKDWAQLNKNLFYAIQLEKAVIAIILLVIVIVAAFNVVSTLMMMIHDKTKEISILKAMGFRPAQGFRLFCLVGVGMGTVGTIFGVGAGLAMNRLIVKSNLISLPADIYYISFLPVVVRWKEVCMIAGCALVISFFATLYPAWKVARRSPLDGLRYE